MRKEKLKTRVIRSKESIPIVYWDKDYVDELDHKSSMDFYLKFPPEGYFIEAIEYTFNRDWHLHSIKEEELKILEQRYEKKVADKARSDILATLERS